MDLVLVSMVLQLVGALAVLVGGTWALGPWFLLAGGVVLLVVPELLERPRAGEDDDVEAGPRAVPDNPEVPARAGRRERRRRAS